MKKLGLVALFGCVFLALPASTFGQAVRVKPGDTITVEVRGQSDQVGVTGTESAKNRPAIDDVIVVDDQSTLTYPFTLDGREVRASGKKTRRLIIHGKNLDQIAKPGNGVVSVVDNVSYMFDPKGVAANDAEFKLARDAVKSALERAKSLKDPDARLISALEKRSAALNDAENLYFVDATLIVDVVPGVKQLILEDTGGKWPLIFANQGAALQFARHGDQVRTQPTTVFYPGDIGAVDLVFEIEMPFDSIGIRLMRRPAKGAEDKNVERDRVGHVLLATRLDDLQAPDKPVFRTEPIHFLSAAEPGLAPPDDPNAFVFNVDDGDIIGARLLDPSRAAARPSVAMTKISGVSEKLGELWKSALRRVAACDADSFDGDPLYALKKSTRFSEITVGELVRYVSPIAFITAELSDAEKSSLNFNPSTDVYKGDHAAAILIRDELVKLMAEPGIVGPAVALANNRKGEIQALRARARRNGAKSEPIIQYGSAVWQRKPFWKQPTVRSALNSLFYQSKDFLTKGSGPLVPVQLRDTLDIRRFAGQFKVSVQEAEQWAVEATQAAAKKQLTDLERAIGRAQKAGDCNLEELLVVAGQKSDAAVARIVPRLVKKVSRSGPPPAAYWAPDKLARGYVERLHLAGGAVRALKQYGKIDDAYKAMAVAVLTAGAATAATAGLSGGAAIGTGLMIAGDVADAAYFGAKGLEQAIESQEFYDYAHGVSLVLGDEILDEAEAQRESIEMAVIGLIAPGIGASMGIKDVRHFRNIDKGKALLKAEGVGVLDNLDSLTKAERTQLAAYYSDLVTKIERSSLSKLDETDRTAMNALSDFETRSATVAPPPSTSADSTAPPPPRLSADADPKGPYIGFEERMGPEFQKEFFDDVATRRWRPGFNETPDHKSPYDSVRRETRSENGKFLIEPTKNYDVTDAGRISFDEQPLGQGSFNTAFRIDDDTIARVPGGVGGRPKLTETIADKGGRKVFEKSGVDADRVRLVTQKKRPIKVGDAIEIPVPGDPHGRKMKNIRLDPGDEIEVLENFKRGTLKDNMKNRRVKRMTAEEAIAYDKGVRELNDKGLVALDLKYDNFGFEPVREGSKDLRLVILDPGGIAPIKGRVSDTARQVQARIDGTANNPGEFAHLWKKAEILKEFGNAIDVRAIDPYLKSVDDIPFNPQGVASFPRGRELSSMTRDEAQAYYQILRDQELGAAAR